MSTDGTQANVASATGGSDLSADGSVIAFDSDATNLVPGNTNGVSDIFIRALATGSTTRVTAPRDGTQLNAYANTPFLSGDGRYVAFVSPASNLVAGNQQRGLHFPLRPAHQQRHAPLRRDGWDTGERR